MDRGDCKAIGLHAAILSITADGSIYFHLINSESRACPRLLSLHSESNVYGQLQGVTHKRLKQGGKKEPFLRAHPATGFFSWRADSVSSQLASENWAQATVRITKAGERERMKINVWNIWASHSPRPAWCSSCLGTVRFSSGLWVNTTLKKKR